MLKGLLKSDWLLYLNKMVEAYSRLVNIMKKTQTARDSRLEITSGEKKLEKNNLGVGETMYKRNKLQGQEYSQYFTVT